MLQSGVVPGSALVESALHVGDATVQLGRHVAVAISGDLFHLSCNLLVVFSRVQLVDAFAYLTVCNFILPHGELQDLLVQGLLGVFQVGCPKHLQFVLDGLGFLQLVGINLTSFLKLLFDAGFEVVVTDLFEPLGLDALVQHVVVSDELVFRQELLVLLLQSPFPFIFDLVLDSNLVHVELLELSLLFPELEFVLSVLFFLLLDVDDGHHVPHVQLGLAAYTLDFELAVHVVQHCELAVDRLCHDALWNFLGDGAALDFDHGLRWLVVEVHHAVVEGAHASYVDARHILVIN